ncbi:MAG: quinol monooxygenase YgiN [Myxococcota bacterium]|jgi:quinol monooxygenase YgiN
MIIIAGNMDLDPEQRDAALNAGQPFIDGALTQDGCEAYTWAADLDKPGRIHVFERWADEASLAAHFKGPHYSAMLVSMGKHGLRAADVAKYRVDLSEPVYDPDNKPRADFFRAES